MSSALKQNNYQIIGKATYCILHDIAADLTALTLNLDLLSQTYSIPHSKLNVSLKSVAHMQDLLNIARDQVKDKEVIKSVNLADELDSVLQLFNSKFTSEQIKLTKNYKCNESVEIDVVKLHRVYLNIVSNAIDALMATSAKKERKFTCSVTSLPNSVKIQFRDTGIGIAKTKLKKIFREHYTANKENGTGIGLFIVKQIIEDSFGGTISVSSRWRKYTEFTIELPFPNSTSQIKIKNNESS